MRDIWLTSSHKVDAVITSPPYANNYDYADALRFEMTFWGEVAGWGDIHDKVRKYLIVSSSQHSSRERLVLEDLLNAVEVIPIRAELASVATELASVREDHGGKKHYHTMIAAYCRDIAQVLHQLRHVCRPEAHMCWVIGDPAPTESMRHSKNGSESWLWPPDSPIIGSISFVIATSNGKTENTGSR